MAMLSGWFSVLALLLSALGLYGVTAYAVNRRRTEIGIRMAIGAAPARIVRLVLARVTVLLGLGVLIGTAASVWASRFIATLLYGLEPRDTAVAASRALGEQQERVTGSVTLKLYKGTAAVVGRESDYALYDERFVTFGEDDVYQHPFRQQC